MTEVTGVDLGDALRSSVKAWLNATKTSSDALSRKIGRDRNYIRCYLGRESALWALPKHPTMVLLLNEIGLDLEALNKSAERQVEERKSKGRRAEATS